MTTLVGPNGAGTTTLFNAMTGHLVPDQGSVTFLGKSILGLPHWKVAQLGIGRTFQDLKLFSHMRVLENVTTATESGSWLWQTGGRASKAARIERIERALDATQLQPRRDTRAKISDRVVVMKAGQVILDTVPEELADNTRLMELY